MDESSFLVDKNYIDLLWEIKMRNNDSNKLTIITLTTLRYEFLQQIKMFFTKNIHSSDRYWPVKWRNLLYFWRSSIQTFCVFDIKKGVNLDDRKKEVIEKWMKSGKKLQICSWYPEYFKQLLREVDLNTWFAREERVPRINCTRVPSEGWKNCKILPLYNPGKFYLIFLHYLESFLVLV